MKKLWKRNMVAGAVLLLVCGAIFLNGRYAQQVEETDKILGQATLVDGTEGDAEEVSGEALPGDYFATARLTRQQARDSALSLLQEASGAAEVDEAAAAEPQDSSEHDGGYVRKNSDARHDLHNLSLSVLIRWLIVLHFDARVK